MIVIISKKLFSIQVMLGLLLIVFSCNNKSTDKQKGPDVEDISLKIQLMRFDNDLMEGDSITPDKVKKLKEKYAGFFTVYCRKICPIPIAMTNDTVIAEQLNYLKFDNDIKEIYKRIDSLYHDDIKLQKAFSEALKLYHYYYPDSVVPQVITFFSAFNYATITTDSVIGAGIDFYLGSDCPFYTGPNFPTYLTKRFNSAYIVSNCMQGWYQKIYESNKVKADLLSQMIYYGKMIYFTDRMLPETDDTVKIGYTAEQLKWCIDNEANIWTALIEQQMLYSTNSRQYNKFIGEGPTTAGFPNESPARIGYFTGWQIVKAYMEKHPDISLAQLCAENDAQKILSESKYKPAKN